MKIIIKGKNISITDSLKNAVNKKLSKLDKYFNPNVEAQVTLSIQKKNQIVEVTIYFNGVILRGEESNNDMYTSIDLVVDKLEGQIRKQKTKLLKRKRSSDSLKFQFIPDQNDTVNEEHKIVRTKRFAVKPMSSEEAVLQMELLGHNFFVYQEARSGEVNVIYRRKDGDYGLIEPEF